MKPGLAIEAHHLTKRFGKLVVVDDVELEIAAGELFGLLGPNGAGKTTLVRMLSGLISISSGDACVAGIDVQREPDRVRRALGVVPQALTSDLDLTGYENMNIYAQYFGVARSTRLARVEELLRHVGLWERRKDLVKTYSGGMRRRLEIARGLIHRPQVLFLDEPTIGLDPQSRRVIWDLLRALRVGGGLTISLTTHYLDEADALCDRVAIVDRGKIVALGTPAQLKAMVPGSDTIELVTDARVRDDTLADVRGLGGVREVTPSHDGLTIRADAGSELLPRILDVLRSRGIAAKSVNLSRVTLEDTFIYFTGRSLRSETGKQSFAPPRRFT